jgi:hypothetical protein
MLKSLKELMDKHGNNPDEFCWEPAFYSAYEDDDDRRWDWARHSYSHFITGNGKIISKEQFKQNRTTV